MDATFVILASAALFGACFGSFLNVCVSRWPAGLSVVRPASRCPKCEREIRWHENVPVLGWLRLRGRCAGCALPISIEYPLVELAVAGIWAASAALGGWSLDGLRLATFATIMFGITLTDAKHYVIPDGFTVFGFLFVLATSVVAFFNSGGEQWFAPPVEAIYGACAGAGFIAIIGWLGEVALKKEAMGFGDATLMAVVGAAVGPTRAIITVFVAAALGAAAFLCLVYPIAWLRARREGREFEPPLVPFGVFLAPAAVVMLVGGSRLLEWGSTFLGVPLH
ncbi:MAG: prepilin peptidase [Gemmatimonadaceae bacterium]|nr:prepilin peptidase [Gemmatimonadaceae bacterium]